MLSLISFLAGEGYVQTLRLHGPRDKLAGTVEAGLYKSWGQLKRLGNFLVGEVVPVAEKQNRAILDRQRIENALHVIGGLMAQGGLLWARADIGDPLQEGHVL
jgi:hypothetical protein